MKLNFKNYFPGLFLSLICISCSSSGNYDQTTVDQAASIKTLALYLMSNATNQYTDFAPQVEDVKQKLNEAYRYSESRANNKENTKQWELLLNPVGNLFGGFVSKWKSQNTLSETYINQAKDLVRKSFDTIINFERSKR